LLTVKHIFVIFIKQIVNNRNQENKMLDLYKNIRQFRINLKMTQDELAKKTGYTDRSSIAKIERGDVDLPQSKIMLFATALNIDAGTLMGDSGVASPALTQDESALLDDYQKLNTTGRQKVREYAADLTEQKKYTQDTGSSEATAG